MAAPALAGRNAWIGIGKQTAVGTPVAATKFYEITDISGLLPEYDFKKSDRRVGTRFKPLGYKIGKRFPFSFTVEANAENIGLLFTIALGADAVAAAGSAWKHTASLAEVLPYFTLWASTDLVSDTIADDTVYQISSAKVVGLSIDATIDDVIKVKIDAIGMAQVLAYNSKTALAATGSAASTNITGLASTTNLAVGMTVTGTGVGASAKIATIVSATAITVTVANSGTVSSINVAAPVPSFPTSRSLYVQAEESQAKVEIGAAIGSLAQFDETKEFHLSLSNGVARDDRIDNTALPNSLREGDSDISGSFKAVYNRNSLTEIKAFQAGTQRAIRFTGTSTELAATGQPYKIVITSDKVRYSGAPTSWDPDIITTDLQFEVEKTTSYPIIEVVNTDAAAY